MPEVKVETFIFSLVKSAFSWIPIHESLEVKICKTPVCIYIRVLVTSILHLCHTLLNIGILLHKMAIVCTKAHVQSYMLEMNFDQTYFVMAIRI